MRFRLNYYLRRYQASDCDARQLHVAAEWMSALLTAGLPLNHSAQLSLAQLEMLRTRGFDQSYVIYSSSLVGK